VRERVPLLVAPGGGGSPTGDVRPGAPTGPAVVPSGAVRIGGPGDPGTVLLSGPGADAGPETLAAHQERWGALPPLDGADVRALARASRLDGRGGGGFPVAAKVAAALASGEDPLLVVNASESEPASAKDGTLCALRPHLVLDGAALLATALGVDTAVVHLHRGAVSPVAAVRHAVEARGRDGHDAVHWQVSLGPGRYVSGEATAVAGFLHDGDGRPRFAVRPTAQSGPSGRPTVVVNAETVAHLGAIARLGADRWAGLGVGSSPGPRLVTVVGAVERPGRVVELTGPGTVGDLLVATGRTAPPAAVLVGGFAGTWLSGDEAWQVPFERGALACLDAAPGCGLLGVLPHGACPLAETARIVAYLAGESAGQCGTCVSGLPLLASGLAALAAGRFRRRGIRRLEALGDALLGSGACGHPDGVVRLVRSTLAVFGDDVVRHLAGSPCRGAGHPPVFAVPVPPPTGRGPRPAGDFA
jgi:NADH:ubiquinone oxidoreductase subunit F (NADH-binding)